MDLIQLSSLRKKLHKRVFSLMLADMTQKMGKRTDRENMWVWKLKRAIFGSQYRRNELT